MKKIAGKILRKLGVLESTPPPKIPHFDEEVYKIDENLAFWVYWKSLDIGTGPAVILKAFDEEILKFDCFGPKKGHYHIAPHYDFRIYFVEASTEDQIARTLAELRINGLRYLTIQQNPKIKALKPDVEAYESVLEKVEKSLHRHRLNLEKRSEQHDYQEPSQ